LERFEDYVRDALGGEDVAAYYGGFVGGRKERLRWDEDFDWF
jgi:hypothetical protein